MLWLPFPPFFGGRRVSPPRPCFPLLACFLCLVGLFFFGYDASTDVTKRCALPGGVNTRSVTRIRGPARHSRLRPPSRQPGAADGAPVTVVVDRKMPQAEADKLVGAFKTGRPAALRKALVGVARRAPLQLGSSAAYTHG